MNLNLKKQLTLVLAIFALSAFSCMEFGDGPVGSVSDGAGRLPGGTLFTRTLLLESFGACIVSELESFKKKSSAFAKAAADADKDSAKKYLAQQAWRDTIDAWQQLEVMQVGPAGRTNEPGGQGFREKSIYAWPIGDYCAVDRHLNSEAYSLNRAAIKSDAKGLGTAEYLLFSDSNKNACESDDEINSAALWDKLDDAALIARRSAYAAYIANEIDGAASALLNAWSPEGENFLAELTGAGSGSRTYGKTRVAINAVSDALFYVEWNAKDIKLARPLGINSCDRSPCMDLIESKYARRSKEHLKNNMIGFRKIFKGCKANNEGLGFDDFLHSVGQKELAEEIDQAALNAIKALGSIEESDLATALEKDIDSVSKVHSAFKQLTTLLRTDFLIALSFELPKMVQSDND